MTGANAKIKRIYVGENLVRPSSRLPSTYQEVEWIGRNGNNYIDTGWIPNQSIPFEVKIGYKISTSGKRYGIISNYSANSYDGEYSFEINTSNKARLFVEHTGGAQEVISSNSINTSSFNDICLNSNSNGVTIVTVNGTDTSQTISTVSYHNVSAYLFIDRALRWSTFSNDSFISYCKIYERGTLVRDFVPCYRKSDNVIGLYDLVNNQFYTNSGSGTFTKGPDVN